jgi:hypothetical protein
VSVYVRVFLYVRMSLPCTWVPSQRGGVVGRVEAGAFAVGKARVGLCNPGNPAGRGGCTPAGSCSPANSDPAK